MSDVSNIRIYSSTFKEGYNLFGQPGVFPSNSLRQTMEKNPDRELYSQAHLTAVLSRFIGKPNWKFVAKDELSRSRDGEVLVCHAFQLQYDNEVLGKVSIDYKGRDYKIAISNHRISAARERGDTYHTTNIDKAVLAIRKYFYPKGREERMESARSAATKVISSEAYEKSRAKTVAWHEVNKHAEEFVELNMDLYISQFPKVADKLVVAKQASLDMQTVEDIRVSFNKGSSLLVVRDGNEYIVRQGDEVQIYDDSTLPYEVRAKLGMLKLVANGQMISDVGCKVDTEVFVIAPAKE
jgi:uncharacterized protein with PhoU and TrkA domain